MGAQDIFDPEYLYDPLSDLSHAHLRHLEEAGLGREIILKARPFSLTGRFVTLNGLKPILLDRLGLPRNYPHELLILPYPGCEGAFRARFDVPEKDADGKPIRYKQPAGQRNYLYQLPWDPGELRFTGLFITEGEKKCMALAQAGCRVIGLGGVWGFRDKTSPTGIVPQLDALNLTGQDVYVCFDSDVIVNRHVQQAEDELVEFLIDKGTRAVFRLRIPHTGEGKCGIDDFLVLRGEAGLEQLFEEALREQSVFSGEELECSILEPTKMLTSLLPVRGLVLLAGVPGAGKTELFLDQTLQAARQGPVVFFISEGGRGNLQTRQRSFRPDAIQLKNIFYYWHRPPALGEPNGLYSLERILSTRKPVLVVIDPGPDCFGEENDASILKEPLRGLYRLAERYNCCILLSWHYSKSLTPHGVYAFRGSTAIAAKVDLLYNLDLSGDQRSLRLEKLRLDCPGLYQGQRWAVQLNQDAGIKQIILIDLQEATAKAKEEKAAKEQLLWARLTSGQTYSTPKLIDLIQEILEIKESTAKRRLKEFTKQGLFRIVQGAKGQKPALYEFVGLRDQEGDNRGIN